MKMCKLGWLAGFTCVVAAGCGGGGTTDTTDYTSKYVGTWKTGCLINEPAPAIDLATGDGANYTETYVIARTSDTALKVSPYTMTIYSSTDTTCTGIELGTIVMDGSGSGSATQNASGFTSGAKITITVDGQTSIDGKTVDKTTRVRETLATSLGNNATVTIGNKFSFSSADFLADSFKDIYYLEGTALMTGANNATPYPTVLNTDSWLTKQ
jgi:hypothetical protein